MSCAPEPSAEKLRSEEDDRLQKMSQAAAAGELHTFKRRGRRFGVPEGSPLASHDQLRMHGRAEYMSGRL